MEIFNLIISSSIILGLIAIIYSELKKNIDNKVDKRYCEMQHKNFDRLCELILSELREIKQYLFADHDRGE